MFLNPTPPTTSLDSLIAWEFLCESSNYAIL